MLTEGIYGVGDGLPGEEALDDPGAEGSDEALGDADPLADALADAATLGRGLGLGDGKRVVGTLARERAKIRMKMTGVWALPEPI